MKEKLTLRNVIIWTVALVGLILFFCSFGATARLRGVVQGDYGDILFYNAVWGSQTMAGSAGGSYVAWSNVAPVGNAFGIIGVILLLLASGGLVAINFLLKNEKTAKILTFVCGGVILVAGILLFFVGETPWYVLQENMKEEGMYMDITTIKNAYSGAKTSSSYGIGGGIVSILLAAGVVASQFIPDVKFIKEK